MRATLRALAAAAVVAGGALSPGVVFADEASDKAEIEDIWTTYSAAVVEGDAETWLGLWDEGGVQMPPGAPARGIDALKQSAPENFASSEVGSMNIYPEEISVADGWAYSRGTYEIDEVIDGQDTHFEGKFMTILRRQDDGSWKIYRDIFNASTP